MRCGRNIPARVNCPGNHGGLICEPAIPAITPLMIATPATVLSFFIIFLLKNSALSGGVSVGGEEGEGGDPSDVKDGANPSGIE